VDSFVCGQDPDANSYEGVNKISRSLKGGRFLDRLMNYQLLKNNSVPER
jgi:hypothetical protein